MAFNKKSRILRRGLAPVLSLEKFRSQMNTSHLGVSRILDSGPVVGINKQFPAEPLGYGLLAEGRTLHELSNAVGERGLAANYFNGALEGGDVGFIHGRRVCTTMVVDVKGFGCSTANKVACNVIAMPQLRQKNQKAERVREAKPGPDGRTLGDRVNMAMRARSRMLGREYTPAELRADASRSVGLDPDKGQFILTQQALSLILTNQTSESPAAIAMASALGVNALWLQYGRGPASYLEELNGPR